MLIVLGKISFEGVYRKSNDHHPIKFIMKEIETNTRLKILPA